MRFGVAVFVALLSALLWRSRDLYKNSILIKSKFPVGYYRGGQFDSHCSVVKEDGLQSCEDATFWELISANNLKSVERRVIASCDPGRHEWNTVMGPLRDPNPRGALWIYTPSKNSAQRIEFKNYPSGHDFHPLGVEVYPSFAGNASNMFVVNHARKRTYIEQFTISPSEPVARHVRTITSRYFNAPNALALTSPTSFYVTNDHLFTRRLPIIGHVLPLMESLLGLPFGWVSHVTLNPDPNAASPIQAEQLSAAFIPFANGISISPGGDEVAVASSSSNTVFIYSRDPTSNSLKLRDTIPIPFTPDNVIYSEDGTLAVAGHPNFPDLVKLAAKKAASSPSWIVALKRLDPNNTILPTMWDTAAPISASDKVPAVLSHEMETVFQSNGTGFSASTTGLVDSATGVLYTSGLYTEGLLVCRP